MNKAKKKQKKTKKKSPELDWWLVRFRRRWLTNKRYETEVPAAKPTHGRDTMQQRRGVRKAKSRLLFGLTALHLALVGFAKGRRPSPFFFVFVSFRFVCFLFLLVVFAGKCDEGERKHPSSASSCSASRSVDSEWCVQAAAVPFIHHHPHLMRSANRQRQNVFCVFFFRLFVSLVKQTHVCGWRCCLRFCLFVFLRRHCFGTISCPIWPWLADC